MKSDIAKGKIDFFDKLKMQLDLSCSTADAIRQVDGSWEVTRLGS